MYNLAIRKYTSPPLPAPRLKIFKWKFTTLLGIEPWTRWTRGRHITIWASAAKINTYFSCRKLVFLYSIKKYFTKLFIFELHWTQHNFILYSSFIIYFTSQIHNLKLSTVVSTTKQSLSSPLHSKRKEGYCEFVFTFQEIHNIFPSIRNEVDLIMTAL